MGSRKPIIGICGGIGAGKSVVAREFERLGALLIDSDRINHEVLNRSEVTNTLRGWWGDEIISTGGQIDRARLAKIVFDDAEQKRRLESLVHPLIVALQEDMIVAGAGDPKVSAIILDSPLLFESNLERICQAVVYVEVSESQRLRRLRATRGWDIKELRRRERWQLSPRKKRAGSRFIIDNAGPIERLRSQVKNVFEQVLAEYSSDQ